MAWNLPLVYVLTVLEDCHKFWYICTISHIKWILNDNRKSKWLLPLFFYKIFLCVKGKKFQGLLFIASLSTVQCNVHYAVMTKFITPRKSHFFIRVKGFPNNCSPRYSTKDHGLRTPNKGINQTNFAQMHFNLRHKCERYPN